MSTQGAGAPAGAERARVPERRRLLVVGVVAVVLALAGVANAYIRPRAPSGAGRSDSAVAPRVATGSATSSAWYCAGPLPVATIGQAASIAVANLGSHELAGEVLVASNASGQGRTRRIRVPPGTESVVGLALDGRRGSAAATVLVDGSGAAVEEIVHGARGLAESPCADHPATVSYLASGSTLGASNLSLSVFDPGATPAVANVSFVTSGGTVSPPAFQGLTVGAGSLQVLDVGHSLPSRPVVATIVSSTGGRVVAGAAVTAVAGRAVMASLVEGVSSASSTWLLPGGPSGAETASSFGVLDPGAHPARVVLRLVTTSGSSELRATVPAHGVVSLVPVSGTVAGAMRFASLTSTGAAVVVGRETLVAKGVESRGAQVLAIAERQAAARAAARAAAAKRSASRASRSHKHPKPSTTTTTTVPPGPSYASVSALPVILPGVAVTSGVSAAARRWVLPGGESDARASEVVVVSNTSSVVAHVSVQQLSGGGSGVFGANPLARLPALEVAPGATLTIDMAKVVGDTPDLPLVVVASAPVVVGQLLYGRKGSGFSLSTAIAAP